MKMVVNNDYCAFPLCVFGFYFIFICFVSISPVSRFFDLPCLHFRFSGFSDLIAAFSPTPHISGDGNRNKYGGNADPPPLSSGRGVLAK